MNRKNIRFKSCPRCGGDLLLDRAYDEFEEVCLQCGYRNYMNNQYNNEVQETIDRANLPPEMVKGSEAIREIY
jgi:DNA-directed RNA polymerase subunit M/transcription elongation factor TFIIS